MQVIALTLSQAEDVLMSAIHQSASVTLFSDGHKRYLAWGNYLYYWIV